MKLKKLFFISALCFFLFFIVSCKKYYTLNSYYIVFDENKEEFALLKFFTKKDSIFGDVFWCNRKDTTQIKGYLKDSVINFKTYRNNVAEIFIYYGIIKKSNQIVLERKDIYSSFKPDFFILKPIPYDKYLIIHNKTLEPPKLCDLRKDTIIGKYKFELKIKNWNPETFYGNTTFTIKNRYTKKILQTINSNDFFFNKHLSFGYSDVNFDKINDLIFFTGFNGGYGTQTSNYYIFNKKNNQFKFNNQLTSIALGMGIKIDFEKKRIISYSKSGCCWHKQEFYKFKNNTLLLVKSLTKDDDQEDILIERLVNERWVKYKIKLSDLKKEKDFNEWNYY